MAATTAPGLAWPSFDLQRADEERAGAGQGATGLGQGAQQADGPAARHQGIAQATAETLEAFCLRGASCPKASTTPIWVTRSFRSAARLPRRRRLFAHGGPEPRPDGPGARTLATATADRDGKGDHRFHEGEGGDGQQGRDAAHGQAGQSQADPISAGRSGRRRKRKTMAPRLICRAPSAPIRVTWRNSSMRTAWT